MSRKHFYFSFAQKVLAAGRRCGPHPVCGRPQGPDKPDNACAMPAEGGCPSGPSIRFYTGRGTSWRRAASLARFYFWSLRLEPVPLVFARPARSPDPNLASPHTRRTRKPCSGSDATVGVAEDRFDAMTCRQRRQWPRDSWNGFVSENRRTRLGDGGVRMDMVEVQPFTGLDVFGEAEGRA